MDIKEELATEALRIVNGSRRAAYGTPERNFERIADLWTSYLRLRVEATDDYDTFTLEPRDVAAMMRLMKEARLIETPGHQDSYLDIVGYALCGAEVSGVKPIVEELAERVADDEDTSDNATFDEDITAERGDHLLFYGDLTVSDGWHVVVGSVSGGATVQVFDEEQGRATWVNASNSIDTRWWQDLHGRLPHLNAEVGDSVLVYEQKGPPEWVVVDQVDDHDLVIRRLCVVFPDETYWVNNEHVLDVRKPTAGSDTPTTQSWADPEHEDGA